MSGSHAHGLSGPIRRRKKLQRRIRELEEAIGLREPSGETEADYETVPDDGAAAPRARGSVVPYAIGGGLLLFAILAIVIVRRRRARAATPNWRRRRRR